MKFEHHLICDFHAERPSAHVCLGANGVHTLIEDFTAAASVYLQLTSYRHAHGIGHHPHLLSFSIMNFWFMRGVVDLLKNGRFARVCSPYYQNSKAPNSF